MNPFQRWILDQPSACTVNINMQSDPGARPYNFRFLICRSAAPMCSAAFRSRLHARYDDVTIMKLWCVQIFRMLLANGERQWRRLRARCACHCWHDVGAVQPIIAIIASREHRKAPPAAKLHPISRVHFSARIKCYGGGVGTETPGHLTLHALDLCGRAVLITSSFTIIALVQKRCRRRQQTERRRQQTPGFICCIIQRIRCNISIRPIAVWVWFAIKWKRSCLIVFARRASERLKRPVGRTQSSHRDFCAHVDTGQWTATIWCSSRQTWERTNQQQHIMRVSSSSTRATIAGIVMDSRTLRHCGSSLSTARIRLETLWAWIGYISTWIHRTKGADRRTATWMYKSYSTKPPSTPASSSAFTKNTRGSVYVCIRVVYDARECLLSLLVASYTIYHTSIVWCDDMWFSDGARLFLRWNCHIKSITRVLPTRHHHVDAKMFMLMRGWNCGV